jgi:hypothetical protein
VEVEIGLFPPVLVILSSLCGSAVDTTARAEGRDTYSPRGRRGL